MKQISTLKFIASIFLGLFIFVSASAQQTVTKKIAAEGGDYTSVFAALQAVCSATADPVLVAGDKVILNIAGTVMEGLNKFVSASGGTGSNLILRVPLKITIQGSGADQSIISGTYPTTNGRMWQVNDATIGGAEFLFKDLSFKNMGSTGINQTGANGAIFNLSAASTTGNVKFAFENVIFSDCGARSLINIGQVTFDVEFLNCLFKNNSLFPSTDATPGAVGGLINKTSGGNISIKNCTFFNNTIKPAAGATTIGALSSIFAGASQNTNLILENNQASNNLLDATAKADGVQGMFGFSTNATPGTLTYSIKNNVCIGNLRPSSMDADFYFNALALTPLTAEGNFVNVATERLGDGVDVPFTYPSMTTPGFDISTAYTYTSPKVNYEMDGAFPKLVDDANKIGHFKKLGTSADILGEVKLRAYTNRNMEIQLDGQVSKAAVATLYDLQGRVVLVKKLSEGSSNRISTKNLGQAIYLLKVKDNQKFQSFKLAL